MLYQGGCHCGRIAYEVEMELKEALDCNCSLCLKRGGLLTFVPAANLRMKTPVENLSTYKFNKKYISHHFCNVCGVAPLSGAGDQACVNVRCLEGVDLASVKIVPFDGRSR